MSVREVDDLLGEFGFDTKGKEDALMQMHGRQSALSSRISFNQFDTWWCSKGRRDHGPDTPGEHKNSVYALLTSLRVFFNRPDVSRHDDKPVSIDNLREYGIAMNLDPKDAQRWAEKCYSTLGWDRDHKTTFGELLEALAKGDRKIFDKFFDKGMICTHKV